MIPQVILVGIQLVEQLLPQLGSLANSAPVIEGIITALEHWLPVVEKLLPDAPVVISAIQGIVAAVRNDPSTTADQLDRLDQLQAIADTAFEAAAAKIEAKLPKDATT